jgi:hypothetical protein
MVAKSGSFQIIQRILKNRKTSQVPDSVYSVLFNILYFYPEYHQTCIDHGIISELQLILLESSNQTKTEALQSYILFALYEDTKWFNAEYDRCSFHLKLYVILEGISQYENADHQSTFFEESIITFLRQQIL